MQLDSLSLFCQCLLTVLTAGALQRAGLACQLDRYGVLNDQKEYDIMKTDKRKRISGRVEILKCYDQR